MRQNGEVLRRAARDRLLPCALEGRPVTQDSSPREERTIMRQGIGCLHIVRGLAEGGQALFPLKMQNMSIGRSPQCHVCLADPGVSRHHADLEWRSAQLVLVHKSSTNSTRVNGHRVHGEKEVGHGDLIQIAETVILRLELDPSLFAPAEEKAHGDWETKIMEEEVAADEVDEIAATAQVEFGSFVDVDIVDSFGMKSRGAKPRDVVLSFERFRKLVGTTAEEFEGQILNCNGDEVMCFFVSGLQAVRFASALLERIDTFNDRANLLDLPFRIRIGVHTGAAAVNLDRGFAYSPTLDVAGHLQKRASVNGMLVSESTLKELPKNLPFRPVGRLLKDGIRTYTPTVRIG